MSVCLSACTGATCYMNSVFQQLYMQPQVRKSLLSCAECDEKEKPDSVFFQMQVHFCLLFIYFRLYLLLFCFHFYWFKSIRFFATHLFSCRDRFDVTCTELCELYFSLHITVLFCNSIYSIRMFNGMLHPIILSIFLYFPVPIP
jgi:hypothetical protein